MNAMADEEVRAFISENAWASGLQVNDHDLCYNDREANVLYIKFPETPLRATYFSRLVALLDCEETTFYGALLWITLSSIGSSQLDRIGWQMVEMMRRGFGENRPLEVAPGNWFRDGSAVDLMAFVLMCFTFGWDAYLIPSGGNYFVRISHDEYWAVAIRDQNTFERILLDLKDLEPVEAHQGLLRDLCPNSRHLISSQLM